MYKELNNFIEELMKTINKILETIKLQEEINEQRYADLKEEIKQLKK